MAKFVPVLIWRFDGKVEKTKFYVRVISACKGIA